MVAVILAIMIFWSIGDFHFARVYGAQARLREFHAVSPIHYASSREKTDYSVRLFPSGRKEPEVKTPLILLAGFAFLLSAFPSVCFSSLLISERTMQDITDAEAAQRTQWNKEMASAGNTRYKRGFYTDPNGFIFNYSLVLPANRAAGAKYPLFIGGDMKIAFSMPSSQEQFPCYTMSVWCPGNLITKFPDWKCVAASAYCAAIREVLAEYPDVDASRISVSGASRFGAIALLSAFSYPDVYAATIPSVAGLDVGKAKIIASRKIGIWMFDGLKDGFNADAKKKVSRLLPGLFKALTDAGYDPMYTEYVYGTHHEYGLTDSLTTPAWKDFTALRKWLFEQKKPQAVWPVINSGLTAAGEAGKPFSYSIKADKPANSFGAELMIEHEEDNNGVIENSGPKGLPKGLMLDPKTGVISGTPKEAGRSFIYLKASNDKGDGYSTLALTVKQ